MTWMHLAILVTLGGAVGLAVGSFLNVVIWRFPRGESLVRPKSRCPCCGAGIAPRDNVPVLGWLLLRGRCRRCGWAIPARYPLVEAATGVAFAAVVACDLGPDALEAGLAATSGRLAYHAALVAMLIATSMIAHDERRTFAADGRTPSSPPVALWTSLALLTQACLGPLDPLGTLLNLSLFIVFQSAGDADSIVRRRAV